VGLFASAVLYLPTVAGSFVTAITASSLGFADWGRLAFGAGLFSWLAVESVLLHRLSTVTALQPALRPTLGIDASWRHRARRNPGTFGFCHCHRSYRVVGAVDLMVVACRPHTAAGGGPCADSS
jgi:hypothetical protein